MEKVFPITIAFLLLAVTVVAVHTPNVSIAPTDVQIGSDAEFKILVKNQGGDAITTFEIAIPETDGKPYYLVKEIAKPSAWEFKDTYKLGSSYPYKITWSTAGLGIAEGKSLEFTFTAAVPSSVGEFTWNWKTIDTKNDMKTDKVVTKTILAPFSAFKLTVPESVKAGEYFQITVAALDKDGKIKTDYTGTVSFASSDNLVTLPADYTYKVTDSGSKEFTVKFKTSGNQTITVKDGTVSLKSGNIFVKPSDAVSLEISPVNSKAALGDAVEFKTTAKDVFGNTFDVTGKTKFFIDSEAKGTWVGNFYKSAVEGTWTVVANYNTDYTILVDGTTLTVSKEGKPQEISIGKMSIVVPETMRIDGGKSATFNLTVKNTGTLNLKDVAISVSGIPKDWIKISPMLADIESGKSYNYLLTISVPENATGEKIITFSTTSVENIAASKTMVLNIGKETFKNIVGLFVAIISRPVYLGIIVVILIVIILIIWSMWPKGTKKKSEE